MLKQTDTALVGKLMRELGDARKTVQRRAIDELVAIAGSGNPVVTEKLREAIASANRRVRWAGAFALGQIGAGAFAMECADALWEAMSDDDGDVRWAATDLMVRLGRENLQQIRARLLKFAADPDTDRNARKMALYCIRDLRIAGPELFAVVERAVHDSNVHVRLAALAVLSRMRDAPEAAARIMLGCLKSDPDAGVRRAAASALGNIQSPTEDAMTALASAAADRSDESLARAARGALDRLEKDRQESAAGETVMATKAKRTAANVPAAPLNDMVARLADPRVQQFVAGARVAHLATADGVGAPHNVPLCYWFDGERIYFAIDEKPKRQTGLALKRMRNIAENPRVAIVIDHYEEDWSQLAYVLIRGNARVVEDPEEYLLAIRHLRDKYLQYRAMSLTPEKNPIVKVEPVSVHVWGARFEPKPGIT